MYPPRQTQAEVSALIRYLAFCAGACDKLHGDTIRYRNDYSVMTWRELHDVTGYGHEVGDTLARHPGFDHISLLASRRRVR